MSKLQVAVVGYGHVGEHAVAAVQAAPDLELTGVVRRNAIMAQPAALSGIKVVDSIADLPGTQAAILCLPTRQVPERAAPLLRQGIHTVDSYDIHGDALIETRRLLEEAAREGGSVAVMAAGWDPGSDSVLRALFEAMAPRGLTTTNFGPGMSMGHTVAVKAIAGVRNALSVTLPAGAGKHKRAVYIELSDGASFDDVAAAIKADPYFVNDETHVFAVDDVNSLLDSGHGVVLERKGAASDVDNQQIRFEMRITNPALTAQMMVSAVRAAARAAERGQPGCYTLPELPVIDLLPGDREALLRRLV